MRYPRKNETRVSRSRAHSSGAKFPPPRDGGSVSSPGPSRSQGLVRKSPDFDAQYQESLREIAIGDSLPVLKGSYKRKNDGEFITDIDNNTHVIFSDELLDQICDMLVSLKSNPDSRFTFLYLACGWRDGFAPPWEIDVKGGCIFDPKLADEWFDSLRATSGIPIETLQKIDDILHGPQLTLGGLIKIRGMVKPYGEILWNIDDIRNGFIVDHGKEHRLLDLLTLYNGILEFTYHYRDDEYVSVTTNLFDKRYRLASFKSMWVFYTRNYYSMLKGIKWKIYPDVRDGLYKYTMERASPYIALSYQIELIKNMRLFTDIPILPIWLNVVLPAMHHMRFPYHKEFDIRSHVPSDKVLDRLSKISDKLADDVVLNEYPPSQFLRYMNRKNPSERRDLELKLQRMHDADESIPREEILRRWNDGNLCPFFSITIEEMEQLANVAQRTYLDLGKLVGCFSEEANRSLETVQDVIDKVIAKNNLRLNIGSGSKKEIKVFDGDKSIGVFPLELKTTIQLFILLYGNPSVVFATSKDSHTT